MKLIPKYNYLCLKEADFHDEKPCSYFYDFTLNKVFRTYDKYVVKRQIDKKKPYNKRSWRSFVTGISMEMEMVSVIIPGCIMDYPPYQALSALPAFIVYVLLNLLMAFLIHWWYFDRRNFEMSVAEKDYDIDHSEELIKAFLDPKKPEQAKKKYKLLLWAPIVICFLVYLFNYDRIAFRILYIVFFCIVLLEEHFVYHYDGVDHLPSHILRLEKLAAKNEDDDSSVCAEEPDHPASHS